MPDADAPALIAADLARLKGILDETVRNAGMLARAMQTAELRSWTKAGSSPVSDADIAANDLIRARLQAATPDYGWLSEETEDDAARLTRRFTWIVDPIDGTRAFLAGREDWCVSVALVERERPVLAAVYAPAADEFFSAVKGGGTTLNGVAIRATGGSDLAIARIAGPKYLVERLMRTSAETAPHPRIGSLALRFCRVADGSVDVAFAGGHSCDWDIVAADLIVTEADGTLTSLAGNRNRYNREDVTHDNLVAAGRERHAKIVAKLRGE